MRGWDDVAGEDVGRSYGGLAGSDLDEMSWGGGGEPRFDTPDDWMREVSVSVGVAATRIFGVLLGRSEAGARGRRPAMASLTDTSLRFESIDESSSRDGKNIGLIMEGHAIFRLVHSR